MKSIINYYQVLVLVLVVLCTACSKDEIYEPIASEKPESTQYKASRNTLKITLEGKNKSFERLVPNRTVVFKNQIWCFTQKVSATINTPNNMIHIWSSSDGKKFDLRSSKAVPYAYYRKLIVFDNSLWLIGGQGTSGIWRSEDGTVWSQLNVIPPFRNTATGAVVVFKGKMFVFEENPGGNKRVFSSTNGRSWHLENVNAFSTIYRGRPIVYKNTLYYIVGLNDHATSPKAIYDIYKSTNGKDWSLLNRGSEPFPDTTIFRGPNWHGMVAYEDKMWIIGGSLVGQTPDKSEIWYSSDMIRWTKYMGTVPFGWMRDHTAITFNDRIFLMGGYQKSEEYYNPKSSREIWNLKANRQFSPYR